MAEDLFIPNEAGKDCRPEVWVLYFETVEFTGHGFEVAQGRVVTPDWAVGWDAMLTPSEAIEWLESAIGMGD